MLAAEHCPYYDGAMPNHELLEVHHSKISLHHAKAGYDYPAIRLPFTYSKLAGLRTRIYQTLHEGALAFLVVVSSSHKNEEISTKKSENAKLNVKSPRLDMAEVAGSNPAEPIGFWLLWSIKASCGS
jgi:hypothetical protein